MSAVPKDSPFDLGRMLFDQAQAGNKMFAAGMQAGKEAEERRVLPALMVLREQFTKATADERARIPTALEVAILGVLNRIPHGASPYTERRNPPGHRQAWERDQNGNYDTSVAGIPMKPGS